MDEIATLTAAGEAGTFEGPTEASVLRTASEGGSFDEADSALHRMFLLVEHSRDLHEANDSLDVLRNFPFVNVRCDGVVCNR